MDPCLQVISQHTVEISLQLFRIFILHKYIGFDFLLDFFSFFSWEKMPKQTKKIMYNLILWFSKEAQRTSGLKDTLCFWFVLSF